MPPSRAPPSARASSNPTGTKRSGAPLQRPAHLQVRREGVPAPRVAAGAQSTGTRNAGWNLFAIHTYDREKIAYTGEDKGINLVVDPPNSEGNKQVHEAWADRQFSLNSGAHLYPRDFPNTCRACRVRAVIALAHRGGHSQHTPCPNHPSHRQCAHRRRQLHVRARRLTQSALLPSLFRTRCPPAGRVPMTAMPVTHCPRWPTHGRALSMPNGTYGHSARERAQELPNLGSSQNAQ